MSGEETAWARDGVPRDGDGRCRLDAALAERLDALAAERRAALAALAADAEPAAVLAAWLAPALTLARRQPAFIEVLRQARADTDDRRVARLGERLHAADDALRAALARAGIAADAGGVFVLLAAADAALMQGDLPARCRGADEALPAGAAWLEALAAALARAIGR